MFAFKVMVSTLLLLTIGLLIYAGTKQESKGGSAVAIVMIVVDALSVMAIWG